jgi:hypothetical protein
MRRYATQIFIASFQPLKWLAKFNYRYAIKPLKHIGKFISLMEAMCWKCGALARTG